MRTGMKSVRMAHATLLGIAVLLAGCASAPTTAPSETGRPGGYYQDDGPGDSPPANLAAVPDAQPKDEPLHKYANQPYVVLGERYVPDASAKPYKAEFYSLSGRLLKTASYQNYKPLGGKQRPGTIVIEDALRQGDRSVLEYSALQVRELPDKLFTKEYLKRLD